MSHLRLLLTLLTAIFLPSALQASPAPLGRLFLTPKERQQLDQLRFANRFYTPGLMGTNGSLQLQGEIRHRSGRRQRWLSNGDRASHQLPELAVGDHFDPGSGQRETLLGNGHILIHRPHSE